MKQKQKENKGITIISLVVTIVLLLIIAGITIGVFTGKSAMVDNATDAKIMTELSQLQDKLYQKRAEGEGKRLKQGNYSGQMTNDDLAEEGVIRKFYLSELKMTVGLVKLSELNFTSNLGNNESKEYTDEKFNIENGIRTNESTTRLTSFTDVFALDVEDNTLYYVRNGQIWKIDGDGKSSGVVADEDSLSKMEPEEVTVPTITVSPENCTNKYYQDIKITVIKGTYEITSNKNYEYYLSTKSSTLSGGIWFAYESGATRTLSGKDDNEYYLFVKEIQDKKGNKSEGGTKVIVSGEQYHRFGPYKFLADKVSPIITLDPDGGKYTINSEETKNINVKVDVTDKESGVKEIKYAWSMSNTEKPTEEQYTSMENGQTVTSPEYGEGTYYLWVKATDNFGNITEKTSNAYVIKPLLPPTVTLKENDENGNEYISGNWTNQDVYHKITLPESEGTVTKYQYSTDGTTWDDISGEIKTVLPYSTGFPIEQTNKPEWLGDLTNNGTYYFVEGENGSIVSNNKGVSSKTANSYIKIDLSQYSENDVLNLTINAEVSSEDRYDFGYATITTTETAPKYDSSTGQFIKIAGTTATAKDYPTTLTGGKIYYLHFGYRKDGSSNKGTDTFTINSIKLESETIGKSINFYEYKKEGNTITYKLQEDVNKDFYVKAIYEDRTESTKTQFKIAIDKTAPVINTISSELTSGTTSKITVSDIKESGSGLKGYYISTNEETPTTESNWTNLTEDHFELENMSSATNYYIWVIDNAGNISEVKTIQTSQAHYKVDNTIYVETLQQALSKANSGSTIELLNDYTDSSTATIDKNIILNTGDYTLTRTATINVKGTTTNTVTLEINGKITSSSNINTLTTSGTVILTGTGTIESTVASTSYRAISNSGNLTQNGELTVSGYYRGVYNSSSSCVFTLNSGKIEATYNNSSAYGLYAYYGTININGGEIKGYYAIYASSSTINIADGNITGTYGIYVSSTSATINVTGGTIEGSTYGIYGYTTANGKITIGDVNEELTETTPIVSGGEYGIFMRTTTISYNFYNGVIRGTNTKPYTDTVNPREGYMVYTYYDYNNSRKYCAVLTQKVDNITIEHNPTEWTNNDVEVEVKYPVIDNSTMQYSEDGENWIDVENIYKIKISENKTVYARIMDESGIVLQKEEHKIDNIDKIAPEVSISPEKTKYIIYNKESETIDINVTVNATDEGGSEIKTRRYGWSESKETKPENWTEFNSGDTIQKQSCTPGTYYLWLDVEDNAGNESEVKQIRYIVELQEAVAKIGEQYFYTVQEAFDAAGTTGATVEIIKDTDETSIVAEGQDIILELNGHTVRKFNFRTSSYYK